MNTVFLSCNSGMGDSFNHTLQNSSLTFAGQGNNQCEMVQNYIGFQGTDHFTLRAERHL